ncbi:MAG: prepilin-type N-terminal cleavage/methylation domain-containing protein [Deltaproteobacteria bacterium]|nr:prepilin-type N-terminal cleavage/methylation domain-containing protein [Deltaproteobacteria bacterium]
MARSSFLPRRLLGFTLIEMMASLAIGSITITVGFSAVTSIHRNTIQIARTVEVEDMAKVMAEYMVSEAQGVGGGFLRPWASVAVVEDDANGDTLYLFQLNDNMSCGVTSQNGQTLSLADKSGNCDCLRDGGADNTAAWIGRNVIVMSEGEGEWLTALVTNANTASCKLTFNKGSAAGNANFNSTFESNGKWPGGGVAAVQTLKYWVDNSTHELMNSVNGGTAKVLAPDIYDMQVSMGWDSNPQNGICFQDGSDTDEWIGNSPADINNTEMGNRPGNDNRGGLKRPPNTDYKDLRQLEIGLIVGVKAGRTESAQILDGTTKQETGIYMKGIVSRATFRNSNIYQ